MVLHGTVGSVAASMLQLSTFHLYKHLFVRLPVLIFFIFCRFPISPLLPLLPSSHFTVPSAFSTVCVVINSHFMFSGVNYPNFATFVNVSGKDFLSFCHVYHFATSATQATFAIFTILPSYHSHHFCHGFCGVCVVCVVVASRLVNSGVKFHQHFKWFKFKHRRKTKKSQVPKPFLWDEGIGEYEKGYK